MNGITGNIGLPFGTMNARIDRNPLIGANGLSKNALDDIMFGNFKGLATTEGNADISSYATQQRDTEGGNMRQILGGQAMNGNGMNAMSSMMGNPQPVNLAALAAANNIAGTQGLNGFNINPSNTMSMSGGTMSSLGLNGVNPGLLAPPGAGMNGFPGPMQAPNPAFGMQLMSQLSNMNQDNDDIVEPTHQHKRHHRKHHKKSTTKLLLRLLVDKMKDIYELDKMTATSNDKKIKSETSAGKVGLTLEDLGIPKDDVNQGEYNKTKDNFKTNLSFPVTVSDDTAHEHVKLMSGEQTSKETDDEDDANIDKILSSLNLKDGSHSVHTSKKSEDLKISELADSVSRDLAATSKYVDTSPKSVSMPIIKGQEMRDEKAISRDTIDKFPIPASIEHDLEMEAKGSLSEFHTVKVDDNMLDSGIKSDLTKNERTALSGRVTIFGDKEPGSLDNAYVTAPELLAVSSFLNGKKSDEDSDTSETKTSTLVDNLPDLMPNKRKMTDVKIVPLPSSDTKKKEDNLQSLTESLDHDEDTIKVLDGANYVKAARVLGSVFKKVKDPVAKNSIETALHAMLQVMKHKANDSSTTKKHHFPTKNNTKLLQQIDNLSSVMQQMKKKRRDDLLRRSKVVMRSARNKNY